MSAPDDTRTAATATTAPAGAALPAGPVPVPAGHGDGGAVPRARRRWPRRLAALTLAVLVGGGSVWWWRSATASAGGHDPAGPAVATGTAPVVRRTLTATEKVDGTLGYADAGSGQLTFGRQGTVTWLPAVGAAIRHGGTAYRVDDQPVPLLYGTLPAWRDLALGVGDGRDVAQLERNLRALGYDPGTVDEHFSAATRQALKAWQEDRGVEVTGEFRRGDAALAAGPVRVAERTGSVGGAATPGQPALRLTSTSREVSVDLPASKQALVRKGDPVRVTLPSGTTLRGRVRAVSRVAEAHSSDQPGGGEPTVGVSITLDDARAAGALDQAPVDVAITTETRRGVLAVPVQALLALAEGGYAVEVDQAGARHLVRVELGLFADGMVEVSGAGLREGMRVVVPA